MPVIALDIEDDPGRRLSGFETTALDQRAGQRIVPGAEFAELGLVLLQQPQTRTDGSERNIENDHDESTLFNNVTSS